jgi:hypothetical protein
MRESRAAGRLGALILSVALFLAPFIGLLYGPELGLFVMAAALSATAYLLRESLPAVAEGARRWLRIVIAIDAAFAIACVVVLVWLLVN